MEAKEEVVNFHRKKKKKKKILEGSMEAMIQKVVS